MKREDREEFKAIKSAESAIGEMLDACTELLGEHAKEVDNSNLQQAIYSLTEAQLWISKSLK